MLAIIGGTGLSSIHCFEPLGFENVMTPYADKPVSVMLFRAGEVTIAFLPRHGKGHTLPPHKINYRANLWALRELDISEVIAVNAVGGIHQDMGPGAFAVPDQIIDYTWGRSSTFFEENLESVTHIDFTNPFDEELRQVLIYAIKQTRSDTDLDIRLMEEGVYGCTQGPRLETAAEIAKLRRDGCDLVGMTAMPEAALARELELNYAMLALSVNWGAGMSEGGISMEEIQQVLAGGMELVGLILKRVVAD